MAMSVVYTTFGGMLVHENRGGTERQYISDPLGSLVGELDSTQAVTYTAEYWPYGEIQTESGTNTSPWSFVGLLGYLKDLASLLYVRARHYLTQKARWLMVDPMWPSEPSYGYTSASPITQVDAIGLSAIAPNILFLLICQGKKRYGDIGLDDPWSNALCKAACFQLADSNKDHSLGPIEMRTYNDCVLACNRLGAKGTKRMWCKGIEALIDHLLRHPKEGWKAINNKRMLEMLLALWNEMGCPDEPPEIG